MTVILHIGYHKTGSTALQSWLSNNRLALAEENIVFPIGVSPWLGHPEIAWACSGAKYSWQDKSYTLAEIEDLYTPYLEKSIKCNKMVVLSSEEFCRLDFSFEHLEILSRFLKKYNPYNLFKS